MKKNLFTKTAALTVAAVMAMGTATFAAPADVKNTIVSGTNLMTVVLPSTAAVAVDAFEIATKLDDGQGGQIASPNYYMVNEGIAEAVFTIEARFKEEDGLKEGVVLVTSKDELNMDDFDIDPDDKRFTLGVIAASGVSSEIGDDVAIEDVAASYTVFGRYDDENVTSIQYMVPDEALKARFLTERATLDGKVHAYETQDTYLDVKTFDADTLGANGIAAFKFYGNVNTYANWDDGDFTLEFIVENTGVREEAYDDANIADGTIGLLTQVGFALPEMEVTKTAINAALGALKINVPASYKVAYVFVNDEEILSTKYTYTNKALTLTDKLGTADTEVGEEFLVTVGFADKYGTVYEEEAVLYIVVVPTP